jgi:uncharacterized protein (DUF952 family)
LKEFSNYLKLLRKLRMVGYFDAGIEMEPLYKIMTAQEWRDFAAEGRFSGSAADRRDGFIHFSTGSQIAETARRHFADQRDLVLLAVAADRLGAALRYESARNGDLFPHLFAELAIDAILWDRPIGTDEAGMPVLPARE